MSTSAKVPDCSYKGPRQIVETSPPLSISEVEKHLKCAVEHALWGLERFENHWIRKYAWQPKLLAKKFVQNLYDVIAIETILNGMSWGTGHVVHAYRNKGLGFLIQPTKPPKCSFKGPHQIVKISPPLSVSEMEKHLNCAVKHAVWGFDNNYLYWKLKYIGQPELLGEKLAGTLYYIISIQTLIDRAQ